MPLYALRARAFQEPVFTGPANLLLFIERPRDLRTFFSSARSFLIVAAAGSGQVSKRCSLDPHTEQQCFDCLFRERATGCRFCVGARAEEPREAEAALLRFMVAWSLVLPEAYGRFEPRCCLDYCMKYVPPFLPPLPPPSFLLSLLRLPWSALISLFVYICICISIYTYEMFLVVR